MRRSGQFKPAGQDPRRGKGGARPGAGRLSREKKAIRAEVKGLVQEYLEKHVGKILKAALTIATGVRRRKYNPKTGEVYYEIEYDGATIRHWINKFVPDAAKTLDINVNDGLEEFYCALEAARRDKPGDSETKVELYERKKTNQ